MTDALKAAIAAIDRRFQSGNGVPVDKATVPAAEWAELRAAADALAAQPAAEPLTAEQFLDVPDVPAEDTDLNTYYSRDVVLACIQAAIDAAQPARAGGDARMADRVAELEDVLRSVDEQFRVYGDRLPDGFDSRVFRWVKDALAAAPQPAPATSAGDPAHALLRSDQCDEAYLRDFVPYKGNPDPLRVWRTAWNSCCAAWMSQPAPAEVLNALDRMDALIDPARGLLTVPEHSATVQASRADMAIIRAAVASTIPAGQPAGGAVPAGVTDKMLALARRVWTIVEEANNSTIAWHGNQIGAFTKAKEAHDEKWTLEIARVLAAAAPAAVERDAREPLTDEQCIALLKFGPSSVEMVRRVERAHGIGSSKEGGDAA